MKTVLSVMAAPALTLSSARVSDYVQLTRPRMALMVLLTVLLGGWLASVGAVPVNLLMHAVIGTALVTAAASALNQYFERETDARMARTANRPLPAGRLTPAEVLTFAIATALGGLTYLFLMLPQATAGLVTAFTFASYVGLYTPAKRVTSLNTLIGAVPGALPPVIGWTAVRGELDAGAIALFLLLFVWQVPHFLAIAWMYREDYARAGHRMLTVADPAGDATARHMLLYLLALVPVSLLPLRVMHVGPVFAAGALILAAYFLAPVLRFRRERSVAAARAVLKASLIYLPGLLGLLLICK